AASFIANERTVCESATAVASSRSRREARAPKLRIRSSLGAVAQITGVLPYRSHPLGRSGEPVAPIRFQRGHRVNRNQTNLISLKFLGTVCPNIAAEVNKYSEGCAWGK